MLVNDEDTTQERLKKISSFNWVYHPFKGRKLAMCTAKEVFESHQKVFGQALDT